MVTFSRAAAAAGDLFFLIDRMSEIDSFGDSGEKPHSVSGTIDLQNVTFSYPTRPDIKVLQDFTLQVPPGKVTALVVSLSTSGKTHMSC